jgi:pyruvate formate lyase activating enzyme
MNSADRPNNSGRIFDLQRFCLQDGPGIRTTVFLKGCPLDCLWCHNPESKRPDPQLGFYPTRCIGCRLCASACPNDAIAAGNQRVRRDLCRACGRCAETCPSGALRLIGREARVSEVLALVLRDLPFYASSGGGVTLSGGEPLHQPEFALALLRESKATGLHTAVETCGHVAWEKLLAAAPYTDLFLYDLKVIAADKHRHFCGADNALILDNARRLAPVAANLIFRAPLVPGYNDTAEDMRLLGNFVRSLPGDPRLELLPYHRIGSGKYQALGLPYPLSRLEPMRDTSPQARQLQEAGVSLLLDHSASLPPASLQAEKTGPP